MERIRKVAQHLSLTYLSNPVYVQFIRFAITGALSATLEVGVLVALVEYFGQSHIYWFNTFAFSLAVGLNYWLSRTWVFESGKYSQGFEFVAFTVMAVIGLLLNYLIMKLAIEQLYLHYLLAKGLAIIIVVAWNFVSKKFIVFKG